MNQRTTERETFRGHGYYMASWTSLTGGAMNKGWGSTDIDAQGKGPRSASSRSNSFVSRWSKEGGGGGERGGGGKPITGRSCYAPWPSPYSTSFSMSETPSQQTTSQTRRKKFQDKMEGTSNDPRCMRQGACGFCGEKSASGSKSSQQGQSGGSSGQAVSSLETKTG